MNNSKRLVITLVVAAFCALCAHAARAEEVKSALQQDTQGWLDIQPEPGLQGWTRIPIPPTNKLGRAQWHVDVAHGPLSCDGDGGHDMLCYDRELKDCIFHVEFCYTEVAGTKAKYNSGVFIRNSADGAIWHQAQLTMDGGYLFGNSPANGQVKRFKLPPTEQKMLPVGQWNTMEVTARGKTLSVWLNGAMTCTWDQCEVFKGHVALEAEGYKIAFRNLKLKELGQ
jgi:hypothetical protein